MKVVDRGIKQNNYLTIYPNPVHGLLYVNLFSTENQNTTIELYDLTGRKLSNKNISLISGLQNILVDMSAIQKGTYILKVRIGNDLLTKTINKF